MVNAFIIIAQVVKALMDSVNNVLMIMVANESLHDKLINRS